MIDSKTATVANLFSIACIVTPKHECSGKGGPDLLLQRFNSRPPERSAPAQHHVGMQAA